MTALKKQFKNEHFNIIHRKYDTSPPNNIFTLHIHDFYELYFFLQGDITYNIEGKKYKINTGDLLIINNEELHRPIFNSDNIYERITVHFNPWYICKYNTEEYSLLSCFKDRNPGQYNKITKNKVIENYFQKISKYMQKKSKEIPIMIETLFIQLLIKINELFHKQKKKGKESTNYNDRVLKIINYINKNLEKRITLNLLAKKFALDKYYLSHLFKENTGFSLLQYVINKKIMKAKGLLSSGFSCGEVCDKLSFGDYSNFYKTFKKKLGVSPSEYKKKNKIE